MPAGGFFFWLELNEPLTAAAVFSAAIKNEVAVTPGAMYFADQGGDRSLRLVFSALPPEDIRNAIYQLAQAMIEVSNQVR